MSRELTSVDLESGILGRTMFPSVNQKSVQMRLGKQWEVGLKDMVG
jgi:hypothetical protein